MTRVGLCIVLESERGKPISLARIDDRELLMGAAIAAISKADQLALSTAAEDELLGEFYRQEAQRLRLTLETVIPELQTGSLKPAPALRIN